MDRPKFREQFLKKVTQGHFCEIISKSDQRFHRTLFKEFLHVIIVQTVPIHQGHVYRRIKISRTIFEKGHPRNNSVKLFQNLSSGFTEHFFLRISICLYSASSPHSPESYLLTDQNFANSF